MGIARNNHFVPEWYQKGFMDVGKDQLFHINRREIELGNGARKTVYSGKWYTPAQRFYTRDLYSTFFHEEVNDEIERKLFGPIDENGSKAVRAFLTDDIAQWHKYFQEFFTYLDSQKIRTPKGLEWIQSKYPKLSQMQLMMEMQSLRSMHCTLWSEGVRELVSAGASNVKFIVSDHPVTVYNYACPPGSQFCQYPSDPDITLKGSQTIFPLNKNRCLILTNLENCQDNGSVNPLEQRTNATRFRNSMLNTNEFINDRKLDENEVIKINHVIKSRCQSSVAAGREAWLYPEKEVNCEWADIRKVLLPSSSQLYRFSGEIYGKNQDGSFFYQDAFGRTKPKDENLEKKISESQINRNDQCGCGSGKKYKKCCRNVDENLRTTWKVLSIRERNLVFCGYIRQVLGLDNGVSWLDVRRNLSEEQIVKIYKFYAHLWPQDTDIYSMLPKSDGKFRGLYSGPLDIRVIDKYALPLAAIFDELLIEIPLVNPNTINPEYSPTKSPGKYRYQVMKDILFMLNLEPYIELGLINLIPDPCEFDPHLMRGLMEFSRDRGCVKKEICDQDRELVYMLTTEDMLNTTAILPEGAKIQFLMHEFGMSENDALKAIADLQIHSEASPLRMLHDIDDSVSGQLMQYRMAPNFEMSLFVAQVTGSIVVTDSPTRWQQLIAAQNLNNGFPNYPWKEVIDKFSEIPIDRQFLKTYKKSEQCFAITRNLLRDADQLVLENDYTVDSMARLDGKVSNFSGQIEQLKAPLNTSPFKNISPEGGLHDPTVQRLLALSSCLKHDDQVRSIYGIGF